MSEKSEKELGKSLEELNAEIKRELERILGPETPDEDGMVEREREGVVGKMDASLREASVSKHAPHLRMIGLTLTGALGPDQFGGVAYVYSTMTGQLSRQTVNSPIDVFKDEDPSEHSTVESYRRVLYERIGQNTTRVIEGAVLERELGLQKGAESEYMDDFLQGLKNFMPKWS